MSRLIPVRRIGGALLGGLLVAAAASAQTTWFVDADAAPGGDGTTWATAFRFPQDALAVARPGDEVRVGQGTYQPDRDAAHPDGTGDRAATFALLSGVALRGGYAGSGQPDPDARDVAAYQTTFSGDLAGDDEPADFPSGVSYSDNSYHVVTGSGADATAVLDGFTITAGNARGAAVECGGGMYILEGGPSLVSCTFDRNTADDGGGLHHEGGVATIVTCTFSDNIARLWYGGGMCSSDATATLIGCRFLGNRADVGGGIATLDSDLTLVDCLFGANWAPT